MTKYPISLRSNPLAFGAVALTAVLALAGCANLSHKTQITSAARIALTDAGLSAGAEAFDTGTGLSDRYHLLVCAAVPSGQESDEQAMAGVIVDVLNAVRNVGQENGDRVTKVSIRLTDEFASKEDLNNWCRGDARTLPVGYGAVDFVSIPASSMTDRNSADFDVPYQVAELLAP